MSYKYKGVEITDMINGINISSGHYNNLTAGSASINTHTKPATAFGYKINGTDISESCEAAYTDFTSTKATTKRTNFGAATSCSRSRTRTGC